MLSAATLTEVPIVPEDATTAQLSCHTEISTSIPICSVEDHVLANQDLSSNASIPVLSVVDSSVHDNGSVICPALPNETTHDDSSLTTIILDHSESFEPDASPVSALPLPQPSITQSPKPNGQSASGVETLSTVLPVSHSVEQLTDNNTNKAPSTSSSCPITTPAAQPRSSIMSSEDEDEDEPPEAEPETESRERTQSMQKRLSKLEALCNSRVPISTRSSRMTRQDADARKHIANIQSEHRARLEHLQRVCEEQRAEKDAHAATRTKLDGLTRLYQQCFSPSLCLTLSPLILADYCISSHLERHSTSSLLTSLTLIHAYLTLDANISAINSCFLFIL